MDTDLSEGVKNMANDELIRKKDALDALMAERKHLLDKGQKGAEHVLTHHGYNVIDELPPVQSDVPDINAGDMIYRQAAIDAIHCDIVITGKQNAETVCKAIEQFVGNIKAIPPVQPTLMRSIGKLVGYTGNHCPNCGRLRVERYESGLEICEKCNWCEQTKSYWLDWEEG